MGTKEHIREIRIYLATRSLPPQLGLHATKSTADAQVLQQTSCCPVFQPTFSHLRCRMHSLPEELIVIPDTDFL